LDRLFELHHHKNYCDLKYFEPQGRKGRKGLLNHEIEKVRGQKNKNYCDSKYFKPQGGKGRKGLLNHEIEKVRGPKKTRTIVI